MTVTAAERNSASRYERSAGAISCSRNKKKRPPLGTSFSFTLNERAAVSFSFTRNAAGRKVTGRCVAQTNKNHHKPRCARMIAAGILSFTGHAGSNRVSFAGRISHTN